MQDFHDGALAAKEGGGGGEDRGGVGCVASVDVLIARLSGDPSSATPCATSVPRHPRRVEREAGEGEDDSGGLVTRAARFSLGRRPSDARPQLLFFRFGRPPPALPPFPPTPLTHPPPWPAPPPARPPRSGPARPPAQPQTRGWTRTGGCWRDRRRGAGPGCGERAAEGGGGGRGESAGTGGEGVAKLMGAAPHHTHRTPLGATRHRGRAGGGCRQAREHVDGDGKEGRAEGGGGVECFFFFLRAPPSLLVPRFFPAGRRPCTLTRRHTRTHAAPPLPICRSPPPRPRRPRRSPPPQTRRTRGCRTCSASRRGRVRERERESESACAGERTGNDVAGLAGGAAKSTPGNWGRRQPPPLFPPPPLPPLPSEAKQAAQERARAAAARGPFARALARLVPRKMRREGYAPAARGAGVEAAQDEDKKD